MACPGILTELVTTSGFRKSLCTLVFQQEDRSYLLKASFCNDLDAELHLSRKSGSERHLSNLSPYLILIIKINFTTNSIAKLRSNSTYRKTVIHLMYPSLTVVLRAINFCITPCIFNDNDKKGREFRCCLLFWKQGKNFQFKYVCTQ